MKINRGSLRPAYYHMILTSSSRLSMSSSSLTYYIAERIRGIRSKLACYIQFHSHLHCACQLTSTFLVLNAYCVAFWFRLVQSFKDFADHYNTEKIPVFEQKFPKEFYLCHVVEIWKYIAKYQEKLRRRRAF